MIAVFLLAVNSLLAYQYHKQNNLNSPSLRSKPLNTTTTKRKLNLATEHPLSK